MTRASSCSWPSSRLRCGTWRGVWCPSSARLLRTAAPSRLQQSWRRCSASSWSALGSRISCVLTCGAWYRWFWRSWITRSACSTVRERDPDTLGRFPPRAAATLCWSRQLKLRAGDTLGHFTAVQNLYQDSGVSQQVLQRFQQVVDVLQDFGDGVRSAWSSQLDSDCGFILQQPLLQHNQQGMLGVNCSYKLEAVLRQLRCVSRETDVELHPLAARLYTCIDDITQSYLSLSRTMSCYSQAVSDAPQEEIPLTQNQLQDLNRTLSDLQRTTWSCEGVLQLVEQQRHRVMMFHATVSQARANMDAMTRIIQGWAELQLLQRSADSLLEGGATEQSCRRIRDEGQELLRLTQVNRSLYAAEDSSESWITYLDHIDDKVQHGLFHMLLRSLHFLSDNMNPQSSSSVFLAISLQLQETGSVFEPSVGGGLTDLLKSIISDIYTAASLPPRISVSRHGNYQECLQKNPELCALEQEVMRVLVQVREEAGLLKLQLDRFSFLWTRDRTAAMDEFLTYSRQLGRDEMEADQVPPALRDFSREIESLDRLRAEVTQLDDVVVLHSWLQVDLRPFRDSLLSVLHHWRHLYTDYLLRAVSDSLKEVTQRGEDEESSSSSRFPLTETILLLEAAGVELPEHMAAQLQC
ncbi:dynein heavy chain 17, axonemal isoform X2 [Perca flavescens]|uniref:dynein heavy chain 17, axonemal isoform X2 n=1 Tax=Perca flavescens TaxID=8167 RepID=UPI00106DF275|nr:dynein heavy chain 17, axonemal-like isoform X2 [Perca flavescens]